MNFVYLYPNLLTNYHKYTEVLQKNGVTVLGVGDVAFEELSKECRDSFMDYQHVEDLGDYEQMYKACEFFSSKYGKIDWLESNDEFWLERDARLRTDFNITTGLQNDKIAGIRYKSKMKYFYEQAGIPTPRYHMVDQLEDVLEFVEKVGYPVIVKPDNGVGSNQTYKLSNEEELRAFYKDVPNLPYIMEEFVNGRLVGYEGVCNSKREVLFESSFTFSLPAMEIVHGELDAWYYTDEEIPEKLQDAGRRTIAAFDGQCRFFHCDFFELSEDKEGLGKKGDIIGLEVNFRPAGGYSPDMMSVASGISVFQVWADMICYDESRQGEQKDSLICVYSSQRKGKKYLHSYEDIVSKYANEMVKYEELSPKISGIMGDYAYIAKFDTKEEALAFVEYVDQM